MSNLLHELLDHWQAYKAWIADENERQTVQVLHAPEMDVTIIPTGYYPKVATIEGFLTWLVAQRGEGTGNHERIDSQA